MGHPIQPVLEGPLPSVNMAKRKAAVQNGQVQEKKQKNTSAGVEPVPAAVPATGAAAEKKRKPKRLGKADRLRAAAAQAAQAAEAPLAEPVLTAALPSERADASGAAAAAAVPAQNGSAAVHETVFRNKEKVLLLSSRGITHRCGSQSSKRQESQMSWRSSNKQPGKFCWWCEGLASPATRNQ